ncbi:putative beta-D-xylosidase [Elaeis guineensis]|uniref:putative beta-D-xylosidase n=1 Tax=Elaeis guineensis var. tenera TaxID=51953 RepID=UPI003C6CFB68
MLIRQVSSAAKGPVILVVLSAGGVNLEPIEKDVDAVIWAGYPGEEGGQAIADVVFGKYNPGGRLPVTWYKSNYVWQLPMTSMRLRPVDELGYPGRTYKFFNGSTLYPFGYGLGYTNFSYKVVSTQNSVEKKLAFNQYCLSIHYKQSANVPPCSAALVENLDCNEDITVEIEVINMGSIDGSDVVMLYSRLPEGIVGAHIMQLIGFQRTFVQAGKSETVTFKLSSCKSVSMVTDSAYMVLPAGQHTMIVGSGPNAVAFPFLVKLAKFRK